MNSKEKLAELQAQGQRAIDAAKAIAEAAQAAGREMSPSEKADYDRELAAAQDWIEKIKSCKADIAVDEKCREISEALGGGGLSGLGAGGPQAEDRRLAFGSMAGATTSKILAGAPDGQKALATGGSVVVEQTFTPDPVALGKPATSILSVLPVTVQASPQFAYLRQTVRTSNAAVVAEGAVKPTSVYTLTRIADQLDVVAHLSEAVPRFWLVDSVALEQFLASELEYGLQLAIEALVVADVAGTSGVQSQAYSTSVLQTLRKTLTKLETTGYAPGSIWINPADFEAIELALSSVNAVEHISLPFDAAARQLWGTPLVCSNAVAAGVSYTVAAGAVGLNSDSQGVQVTWSESSNADDWSKNLIRARCEGRWATSVFAPLGIVVGDLTP